MLEIVEQVTGAASRAVWGWPSWPMPLMVMALLGTGIFLTLRLRFINIRGFWHAIRIVKGDFDDPNDPGDISHFQALTTALSATVGVGNIAGVATAIHYGGPGALLWMWVTALFGMTTKYTECTLALRYRRDNLDGTVSGGPMYYIERGLGPRWKFLALLFAACATISSLGSGNGVQAHTMADNIRVELGVPPWITGALSATLVGLVILGGIRRIGNFTSRVIPAMAALYLVGTLTILALNAGEIPSALATIFRDAFRPSAAIGGFAGATLIFTLTWGVKRGLFSNEAGQGSAPIAHAAARTDEAVREGSVALLEPFIDTLSICTLTGLVIVCTGVWSDKREVDVTLGPQSGIELVGAECRVLQDGKLKAGCEPKPGSYAISDGVLRGARFVRYQSLVDNPRIVRNNRPVDGVLRVTEGGGYTLVDRSDRPISGAKVHGMMLQHGSALTSWAFARGLDPVFPYGGYLVTLCVFLFALSTAIGWSYYGERAVQYLLGDRAILGYRSIFVIVHFGAAIFPLEAVWNFSDVALGMMALPNLLAILLLSGEVAKLTRDYYGRRHTPVRG